MSIDGVEQSEACAFRSQPARQPQGKQPGPAVHCLADVYVAPLRRQQAAKRSVRSAWLFVWRTPERSASL